MSFFPWNPGVASLIKFRTTLVFTVRLSTMSFCFVTLLITGVSNVKSSLETFSSYVLRSNSLSSASSEKCLLVLLCPIARSERVPWVRSSKYYVWSVDHGLKHRNICRDERFSLVLRGGDHIKK